MILVKKSATKSDTSRGTGPGRAFDHLRLSEHRLPRPNGEKTPPSAGSMHEHQAVMQISVVPELVGVMRMTVDFGLGDGHRKDRVAQNPLPLLGLLQRNPAQRHRGRLNHLDRRKPKETCGARAPAQPRKSRVPEDALVWFDGPSWRTQRLAQVVR